MSTKVELIRRNLQFRLPRNRATDWNGAGKHVTQVFNTLSLFFPVGERFFIQSLRNYRHVVDDPQLKEDVAAFIGQEAFHGREHDEYNEALVEAGLPVDEMEAQVTFLLEQVKRLPKSFQLAATVSLEHLTAIMGDILLREPKLLEDAEPHFQALWRWHAMEETEHKAVSFDVYTKAMGRGPRAYALRSFTFILANAIFWTLYSAYYLRLIQKTGGMTDLRGWWQVFQYQWGSPGAFRRLVPSWLEFFRPGFHPWDQDNRELLAVAQSILDAVEGFEQEAEAAA
ncbi:metal-dependent hydrolase [Marinobacteraceae bacterium S3BR75-40.1]